MRMRFFCSFVLAIVILGLAFENSARAQSFSVLYNFGSNGGDPKFPGYEGIIAQGRDGNLYSTAPWGGSIPNNGAIFRVTPRGTLSVLYNFDNTHGAVPSSGLTLGTDGNFYGTTQLGGTYGWGTVFKATPSGKLTVMYNFTNGADGGLPYAPPIEGTDGNFYGTTFGGGGQNGGTMYKITPSGKFSQLYQFDQSQGIWPYAPVVQGADGNFYGTTSIGGANGDGVVFRITPAGKFTLLYSFDGMHGTRPNGPLVQGSDGNFYGTTTLGGNFNWGVVFKITANGRLTVLHNMNKTTDGGVPIAGLVQATDGNLYGVNSDEGTGINHGTIFKISPKSPYNYSVLYDYSGTEGYSPEVTLLQHTSGILYGDNYSGGTAAYGTFFSFNLGLKPFVNLLPTSGKVGKTIGILGQGFKGTTGVSFNGTPATFAVISGTYLTAKVPSGATSGFVTVTTPKGKLKSNKTFRVI